MKIVRFTTGGRAGYGTLDDEVIHGIEGTPYRRLNHSSYRYDLSDVKLLPPCTPSKVVAIGRYEKEKEAFSAKELLVKCPTKYEGRVKGE